MSPCASEPDLRIEFPPGLHLEKVFGYEPKIHEGSVDVRFDNMNGGMTEVVLLRFRTVKDTERVRIPVQVRLSYFDLDRRKEVVKTETSYLQVGGAPRPAELADSSVAKNYAIATLAQSIKDMATACESGDYRRAEEFLAGAVEEAHRQYPSGDDEDIRRTLATAEKYRAILERRLHRSDGDGHRHGDV
jgi:hypothetical protein